MSAQPFVLHEGDVRAGLRRMEAESVQLVVTSTPYWALRFYQTAPQVWGGDASCAHQWGAQMRVHKGGAHGDDSALVRGGRAVVAAQAAVRDRDAGAVCSACGAWRGELGAEPTPQLFVEHLVEVLREVRRVLRPDGIVFLNIGDSYVSNSPGVGGAASSTLTNPKRQEGLWEGRKKRRPDGLKVKDLALVPERLAIALQADGWWVRRDIIWEKENGMPESARDRPRTQHEYVWMLTKSDSYFYDDVAVRIPAAPNTRRDKRDPRKAGRPERGFAGHIASRGAGLLGDGETAQLGSVWRFPTAITTWDYCLGCESFFLGAQRKHIKVRIVDAEGNEREAPDDWLLRDDGRRPTVLQPGERKVMTCPTCRSEDQWVDHFAIFPEALAERAILAGTSAHGACAACGAPWERVVERVPMGKRAGKRAGGYGSRTTDGLSGTMTSPPIVRSKGWAATCPCNVPDVRPCLVLDPFAGSGTALVVALNHGRHAVGVELNPKYAALARERVKRMAPAATARRLDLFTSGGTNA